MGHVAPETPSRSAVSSSTSAPVVSVCRHLTADSGSGQSAGQFSVSAFHLWDDPLPSQDPGSSPQRADSMGPTECSSIVGQIPGGTWRSPVASGTYTPHAAS